MASGKVSILKKNIISLENKTIYKLISLLGFFIPMVYIIFGYKDNTAPTVLKWICVVYTLVMSVFFVIRSKDKKAKDIPSLVGILVPLVLIIMILTGFL